MVIGRAISRIALAGALAAVAGAIPASADIRFSDNFSTNGALVGSTPAVGTAWGQTGAVVTNPLTVAGGVLSLATSGQDAFGTLSSAVTTTAGTKLFTGFDVNISAAQAAGDYFLHLSDPAGTTTNFYQRIYARSSGAGFQLGLASNSGTGSVITYGTTVLNFNQSYRVVSSWEFVAGAANDVFNIYVDPTDSTETNNTAYIGGYVWTGNAEPAASLAAVNIRQGTAANAPTLTTDNLVVATLFGEVAGLAAIPEPGTFALLGLAALPGVAFLRRRK